MLVKRAVLDRIASGEIDTVFRRQRRPTVRTGGTLRTAIGMIDIVSIEAIELDDVTDDDATRAGYASRADLVADLTRKPDGTFYRVRVRPGGPDPRIELRADDRLSPSELGDVRRRLDRLDAASVRGPWTHRFLSMIADRPHVRAGDLAGSIGWETPPFKSNVAKLKALGLTISHRPGYELSPRGRVVLRSFTDVPGSRSAG